MVALRFHARTLNLEVVARCRLETAIAVVATVAGASAVRVSVIQESATVDELNDELSPADMMVDDKRWQLRNPIWLLVLVLVLVTPIADGAHMAGESGGDTPILTRSLTTYVTRFVKHLSNHI
jgi:hypothetical protein